MRDLSSFVKLIAVWLAWGPAVAWAQAEPRGAEVNLAAPAPRGEPGGAEVNLAAPAPRGETGGAEVNLAAPALRGEQGELGQSGEPDVNLAAPSQQGVPEGFYRDDKGRVMQVSFDLDRRLWLGVAYAPRQRSNGATEIAPAAFEFGAEVDFDTDARTRHRLRLLAGEARLHPFGLDVTALRYDISHKYDTPLLRITTFFGEPERHDLYLNVGFFSELLHFDVAPRGIDGEYLLTLATAQATIDLWQSADLRSYVRLRAGPAIDTRIGPWGDQARFVGVLPETTLEGRAILGARGLSQATFRLTGQLHRSLTFAARPLPETWLASGEASWERVLIAINDQPLSLLLGGRVGLRDGTDVHPVDGATARLGNFDWTFTAGFRMSFFSAPVPHH